ncbi:hypothetical protein NEUTE1DRAFT_116108 [Neurospora tetrasperma FGSC 2508]|uniref:Uncharacterized protein n=1 Tax=Neurospora tetrasperma (strain FGSC 2508 / ATCC MYA-4615 / P0657) TaxID=510951 RepID=F8MDH0_NEUT8|nr:uncharacterized protein NEUTE1DRAFT_116108 [Neurospora tetrasperma FGSC 2508]EGO61461.1 hypothetical protein NEUTE1DRAFT_116108 [Neurospora tetrasperma FGSC 2508]EGZ74507.1 hypothetical protein NEUTE2DRAFT_143374 [Neurospora tetrasperma FGSC 2509]
MLDEKMEKLTHLIIVFFGTRYEGLEDCSKLSTSSQHILPTQLLQKNFDNHAVPVIGCRLQRTGNSLTYDGRVSALT